MITLRGSLAGAAGASAARGEALEGLEGPRRTLAIACVLGAMSLVVLSAAGANVALPALAGAFHATPAQAVRVVSAYHLALVMALLP